GGRIRPRFRGLAPHIGLDPYRSPPRQADRSISSQVTSRFVWYAMRPRIEVSVASAAICAMLYGFDSRMLVKNASTASIVISRFDSPFSIRLRSERSSAFLNGALGSGPCHL